MNISFDLSDMEKVWDLYRAERMRLLDEVKMLKETLEATLKKTKWIDIDKEIPAQWYGGGSISCVHKDI